MVQREVEAKQNENPGGNRLREVAVAVHYVKDPKARSRIPDHAIAVGKQNTSEERGRTSAIKKRDEERRERDPGEKVQGRRRKAEDLQKRGQEDKQPSSSRRWSHAGSLQEHERVLKSPRAEDKIPA